MMCAWVFGAFSVAAGVNQIAIAMCRRAQSDAERHEARAATVVAATHQHELVNPQGGVALSTGADDSLAMVVGSVPCVTVEPAPSML
jgi:ATP/maltotriose-dependent transcriptional regulator MalT